MRISDYPEYSIPKPNDYLVTVSFVSTDKVNKKIQLQNIFNSINYNVAMSGNNTTLSGNNFAITCKNFTVQTTANVSFNSITNFTQANISKLILKDKTTEISNGFEAASEGKISFDNNYLYVKTANNVTKRIALSSF